MQLLPPDGIAIDPRYLADGVASLSLDVETDFGTGRTAALAQLPQVIDLLAELRVPWTAFVEGHFFESRQDVVRRLVASRADVQLHCYDHSQPNDTPETLARSAAAYADLLGRRPAGYRAHTYRLTRALYDALLEEGFRWDSSLMRALAQGRNADPAFARGDYLVLDGRLVEFPIGRWRSLPIAFNHTHVALAQRPGEAVLRTIFSPPRLVVYNFHMTDLVRCDSLTFAKRTATVKLLYRYLWSTHPADTFAIVRRVVGHLAARGYAFETMQALYERVAAPSVNVSTIVPPAM